MVITNIKHGTVILLMDHLTRSLNSKVKKGIKGLTSTNKECSKVFV